MKNFLCLVCAFLMLQVHAYSQDGGACNVFANDDGLSESDPNDKVSYSVANGELTITFTDAGFWANNEVKWEFPTAIDISGSSTTDIAFEVAVISASINNGTGAGCAAIDYILLGMGFYDQTGTYSNGTDSEGYVEGGFVNGSVVAVTSPANASSIAGIFIKPAFFIDTEGECNTIPSEGGFGTISSTIKIKNLRIGNAVCATAVRPAHNLISASKIYPNPSSDRATISLDLKSAANIKVTLNDLMGKEIKTIAEGSFTQLTKEVVTSDLAAGTYMVTYRIDGAIAKSQLLMVQ